MHRQLGALKILDMKLKSWIRVPVTMLALSTLSACSSIKYGDDFEHTRTIFQSAKDAYTENPNSEPLAFRTASSKLNGVDLTIKLKRVVDDNPRAGGLVRLEGLAGEDSYQIGCSLSPAETERLRDRPESLAIGGTYRVRGKLTGREISSAGMGFRLMECSFAEVSRPTPRKRPPTTGPDTDETWRP